MKMVRKHFFIDEWLYNYMKKTADFHGTSVSQIIRGDISIVAIQIAMGTGFKSKFTCKNIVKTISMCRNSKDLDRLSDDLVHEGRNAVRHIESKRGKG